MGFLYALIFSASFGLIPLFSIPLLRAGISVETTLVYRFGVASIALWLILRLLNERIRPSLGDLGKIIVLSAFYLLAVLLFFHAFAYLPSGVVATIQYLYPLMVMLLMILFCHERFHPHLAVAASLGIIGVALVSSGPELKAAFNPESASPGAENTANILYGIALALISALGNALYVAGIQIARLKTVNSLVLTFLIMLFGSIFCLGNALCKGTLQWLASWQQIILALLLALITAVLSNLTMILAIKRIGSTLTAVLGVLEPLTAVIVGVLVFHEPFNAILGSGIALILLAVLLVILWPKAAGRLS